MSGARKTQSVCYCTILLLAQHLAHLEWVSGTTGRFRKKYVVLQTCNAGIFQLQQLSCSSLSLGGLWMTCVQDVQWILLTDTHSYTFGIIGSARWRAAELLKSRVQTCDELQFTLVHRHKLYGGHRLYRTNKRQNYRLYFWRSAGH